MTPVVDETYETNEEINYSLQPTTDNRVHIVNIRECHYGIPLSGDK